MTELRKSSRVSKPPENRMAIRSIYEGKYLLFFIRKTKTYHNFARASTALSKISNEAKFIFGQDYPLALKDGIYNGLFIAAENCSKIIRIEKELDKYISDNKEDAYLTDGVAQHMRVFLAKTNPGSSSPSGSGESESDAGGSIDDEDADGTWEPQPSLPSSLPLTFSSPSVTPIRPGPSRSATKSRPNATYQKDTGDTGTGTHSRTNADLVLPPVAKRHKLSSKSFNHGNQAMQAHQSSRINEQDQQDQDLLVITEQQRGIPSELLNETTDAEDATS